MTRFLDTNILMRYFTRDDEEKALAGATLLHRIAAGREQVVTSSLVFFEVVFLLQRTYKLPKDRVARSVLSVLNLRGVKLDQKPVWREAINLYVRDNMDFTDAYNVATMNALGLTEIYAWDHDYDKVPGIHRIEPVGKEEGEAA